MNLKWPIKDLELYVDISFINFIISDRININF